MVITAIFSNLKIRTHALTGNEFIPICFYIAITHFVSVSKWSFSQSLKLFRVRLHIGISHWHLWSYRNETIGWNINARTAHLAVVWGKGHWDTIVLRPTKGSEGQNGEGSEDDCDEDKEHGFLEKGQVTQLPRWIIWSHVCTRIISPLLRAHSRARRVRHLGWDTQRNSPHSLSQQTEHRLGASLLTPVPGLALMTLSGSWQNYVTILYTN